jgi:SAM-dependent methyltransferase
LAEPSSKQVLQRSYDPNLFASLSAIEDRHFWFRARNKVIATLVSQITDGLTPGYRVLEVGCGTGNVLRILKQACPGGIVVGMDLFAEGLRYARQRTFCPLVQGDIHEPPFGLQFNLIGLFDVLEHVPDDMRVLRNLYSLLQTGGILLLTVPAHQWLWSYFDEVAHHCRRYELIALENKLSLVGYRVEYKTHFMASIFPLLWLRRRLSTLSDRRRTDNTDRINNLTLAELRIKPIINNLLTFLLTQETRVIARRNQLPFGTSLLFIARKNLVLEQ